MMDLSVAVEETETLRASMRAQSDEVSKCDRGGDLEVLRASCLEETGLPAPTPQWEVELYGPHAGLDYVRGWYADMEHEKGWKLDV